MFKIGYDKKITMVQGDTGVIRMRISNYELSQGDEVRFAIVNKANPSILLCQHSDKKIVLEKQVTVFEKDGSARIVIYPYDTEYLQPGKYLYEIQVKTKDGRIDTVVPLTSFTLMDGSIQGEYGQTTPSKPEPTPSEIELRFKRLENEIIPELGNRIANVEKDIDCNENKTDWINPDEFLGDDWNKLQTAISLAQETKKTIKLNRVYNITGYGSLNITKSVLFDNIPLRIEGNSNGGIRKNDNGYIFSNGETSGRQFLFIFKNLNFYGVPGSGMKVIQGDKLSGLYIDSCLFHGVDSAIYSESGILQTIRFTNNIIAGGGKNNSFIIDFILGFDVTISNNQFEQCGNAIRQKGLEPTSDNKNPEGRGCNSLRIDSNVIEGCSGTAIEIGCCSGVTISNNYFEGNTVNIDVSKNISLSLLLFSNRFDFTNRPNTHGVIFPSKARNSTINDDKIVCISNLFTAGDSTNIAYIFNEKPDDNIKIISIGENISNTNYPNNIVMYNPSIKDGEINGYIPETFKLKGSFFVEKGSTVVRTLNIPTKYNPEHSTITATVSASKQNQWNDEDFYIDENLARVSILNICISEQGKAKVVLKNNDTDNHADGRIILNIMKRF